MARHAIRRVRGLSSTTVAQTSLDRRRPAGSRAITAFPAGQAQVPKVLR